MANLIVHTQLNPSAALRRGITAAGRMSVRPSAEQLQQLGESDRLALAPYVSTDEPNQPPRSYHQILTVAEPGWEGVVAGLRTQIEKDAAEAAEREAHIERERASYRTMLAAERYFQPELPIRALRIDVPWNCSPNYSKSDPEAKKLWAEIEERRASERRAIIQAADAALEYDVVSGELGPQIQLVLKSREYPETLEQHRKIAPRAYEFEDRLEREKQSHARFVRREAEGLAHRYVVVHVPEYVRAAEDGNDVRGVAVRHLRDRLEERLPFHNLPIPRTEFPGAVEAHSCPNAHAYEILDRVTLLADREFRSELIANITTRIVRADISESSHTTWRTFVELSLETHEGLPKLPDFYIYADTVDDVDDDEDDSDLG